MVVSSKMKSFAEETVSRANVAIDVYNALEAALGEDSLDAGVEASPVASNLVYLIGAILKGTRFQAWLNFHEPFVRLLVQQLPSDHKAWESIDLMAELPDGEVALPDHIKRSLVECRGVGNLDEEDYPDAGVWAEALGVGRSKEAS